MANKKKKERKTKRGGCVTGGREMADDIRIITPVLDDSETKRKEIEKKGEIHNGGDDWAVLTPKGGGSG
jgi:hypothetical protein